MKKIFILLTISLLTVSIGFAQQYVPWDSTQGPLNFNTITAPYSKCTHSTSLDWSGDAEPPAITTSGIYQNVSHKLVTVNGPDPCRCYGLGTNNSAPYTHENKLPPDWSMNPQLPPLDTVVMIGCNDCSSSCQCTNHAQMEYWFYPTVANSTLLVMFTFAEEDVTSHCAYCSNTTRNPQFYIDVLDGQTGQLIPSGYYKDQNGNTNTNWPYNRFMACPDGNQSGQSYSIGPDDYGIFTYYWAHPKATPTTFPYRRCPSSQTSGHTSSGTDAAWFEYKPIAFDLRNYALQHRSVKLRIRVYACSAEYHWAYCMFTAKMIPGTIQVDACGGQDVTLSVPAGFRTEGSSYVWRYGYDSLDACSHILPLDPPPAGIQHNGVYDIYINRDLATLWPYYRCEMLSYTGAPFIYEAHVKSYYIIPGFEYEQIFTNCEPTVQFHDTSNIFTVTPPTSIGANPDTIPQETQLIQWYVKRYGNYVLFAQNDTTPTYTFDSTTIDQNGFANIKIILWDEEQKCTDTLEKTIQLDMSCVEKVYSTDTVYTCEEKLPYVYDPAYFGNTHTWNSGDSATRRVIYQNLAWNGCDSVVDVTLIVQKPKVSVAFDLDYCDEFTTTLTAVTESQVEEYKWSTGETTESITITSPGTYSVVITDTSGCISDPPGTITIPACKPFLNLPNSISPNSDGINDYFSIPQKNLIQELEFTVYNRYGEIIYHTTNKDFEWNGSVNGKLFFGATYTYTLHIVDYEGVSSNHKGSITVLY